MTRGYDRIKRGLDIAVAVPLFVVTLPIALVTAVAIRIRLGKPVLFRQVRPGLHGEPFEMVKFRTMLNIDRERGLIDDASRMTPFGLWLRARSLDELPNLWNVIRGDISLVGPRPLKMSYLALYTPEQARRHAVRPGITGLAQVSGRRTLSWEDRFRLDVLYVDHHTFAGDLQIIRSTVSAVVRRDGSGDMEATMPDFLGTKNNEESPMTDPRSSLRT